MNETAYYVSVQPITCSSNPSHIRSTHHVSVQSTMCPSNPSRIRPTHHISVQPITYPSNPSCVRSTHHVSVQPITCPSNPSHIRPTHHMSVQPITYPSNPSCVRPTHHMSVQPITCLSNPSRVRPTHHGSVTRTPPQCRRCVLSLDCRRSFSARRNLLRRRINVVKKQLNSARVTSDVLKRRRRPIESACPPRREAGAPRTKPAPFVPPRASQSTHLEP